MKTPKIPNELFNERLQHESFNEKLWNDQVALPTFYEKEHSLYEKEKLRKHLWEVFHKTCGLIHIVL